MDTEDYVSFETAKLLKEKGFNWNTDKQFNSDKIVADYDITDRSRHPERYLDAPTLAMVMKWLREVHHIFIDIDYDSHEFGDKPYFTLMTNMDTCSYYSEKNLPLNRATYEEMAEAAIKYCLENLI